MHVVATDIEIAEQSVSPQQACPAFFRPGAVLPTGIGHEPHDDARLLNRAESGSATLILTAATNFKTYKTNGIYVLSLKEEEKLKTLCARYGVPWASLDNSSISLPETEKAS
jgi:hypothetical protein